MRAVIGFSGDLERTLPWFNAPLFLVVLIALSAWVARRSGTAAGIIIALGLVGHPRCYEGFAPTNVDHHGLLAAAVLGLLLGLAFMGAGWWNSSEVARGFSPRLDRAGGSERGLKPRATSETSRPSISRNTARRAAIISALCGAFGLWLSAATMLPVIALAGASAFALALWRGPALKCRFQGWDSGKPALHTLRQAPQTVVF